MNSLEMAKNVRYNREITVKIPKVKFHLGPNKKIFCKL
jgi:hypothetical protein